MIQQRCHRGNSSNFVFVVDKRDIAPHKYAWSVFTVTHPSHNRHNLKGSQCVPFANPHHHPSTPPGYCNVQSSSDSYLTYRDFVLSMWCFRGLWNSFEINHEIYTYFLYVFVWRCTVFMFHIFCEKMKGGGVTKIHPPAHETALIIYRLHITLKINK